VTPGRDHRAGDAPGPGVGRSDRPVEAADRSALPSNQRVDFDFDPPARIEERRHDDHRGCREDLREELAVHRGDRVGIIAVVRYMRVRTTSVSVAPASASAARMMSKQRRV